MVARKSPFPELVPWLDGCMRQARRLFGLIAREPMVEERTFSDYRLSLEQRIEGLQSEISSALKGVSLAKSYLMRVKAAVPDGRPAPGIDALQRALVQVELQARALNESVGAATFKSEMADGLRPLWRYVDKSFGTWQRRVQPSVLAGLWSLLIVGLFYIILGAFYPTIWILLPMLAVALWRMLAKYWNTRFILDKAIQNARVKLAPLRADGYHQDATVWLLKTDDERRLFVSKTTSPECRCGVAIHSDASSKGETIEDADNRKPVSLVTDAIKRGTSAALIALLVAASVMLLLFVGLQVAPHYAVVGNSVGQTECTLTVGSVVWPGPGQLLLLEGRWPGRLNVVSFSRISRLAPEGSAPERCRPISASSLELHSTVVEYPNVVERNRVLAVPIFPAPVHCPPSASTGISEQGKEMIKRLGKAIISCSVPLHAVRLDVRGFASSKEFLGCKPTNDLNLELAGATQGVRLSGSCAMR